MRKSQIVAFLILTVTFALTACGQKGALYLPVDTTTQSAEVTTADEEAKKKNAKAADSSD